MYSFPSLSQLSDEVEKTIRSRYAPQIFDLEDALKEREQHRASLEEQRADKVQRIANLRDLAESMAYSARDWANRKVTFEDRRRDQESRRNAAQSELPSRENALASAQRDLQEAESLVVPSEHPSETREFKAQVDEYEKRINAAKNDFEKANAALESANKEQTKLLGELESAKKRREKDPASVSYSEISELERNLSQLGQIVANSNTDKQAALSRQDQLRDPRQDTAHGLLVTQYLNAVSSKESATSAAKASLNRAQDELKECQERLSSAQNALNELQVEDGTWDARIAEFKDEEEEYLASAAAIQRSLANDSDWVATQERIAELKDQISKATVAREQEVKDQLAALNNDEVVGGGKADRLHILTTKRSEINDIWSKVCSAVDSEMHSEWTKKQRPEDAELQNLKAQLTEKSTEITALKSQLEKVTRRRNALQIDQGLYNRFVKTGSRVRTVDQSLGAAVSGLIVGLIVWGISFYFGKPVVQKSWFEKASQSSEYHSLESSHRDIYFPTYYWDTYWPDSSAKWMLVYGTLALGLLVAAAIFLLFKTEKIVVPKASFEQWEGLSGEIDQLKNSISVAEDNKDALESSKTSLEELRDEAVAKDRTAAGFSVSHLNGFAPTVDSDSHDDDLRALHAALMSKYAHGGETALTPFESQKLLAVNPDPDNEAVERVWKKFAEELKTKGLDGALA